MNKLSNILLAKNKNISNETERFNRGTYAEKTFDRKTLNTTVIGGAKRTVKRKPKFLYVSLAMMAKGLNTEDKLIFRKDIIYSRNTDDELHRKKHCIKQCSGELFRECILQFSLYCSERIFSSDFIIPTTSEGPVIFTLPPSPMIHPRNWLLSETFTVVRK